MLKTTYGDVVAQADAEDRTYAKVTWRLIPFLFLCYVFAYLDRVNVGFAKLQMLADLKFSETVYGLGAGIFFIGYFIFEVPSNIALHRFGARKWIARIMLSWGVLSGMMIFVKTPTAFYVLRFLLGVAEAGFFPGIILYLTYWYPSSRRAKITAMFMTGIPIAGVIGGPLSGWILNNFGGVGGMAGWRWLFLLEALPSIIGGFVVLMYLDDKISSAKWLSADEKTLLEKGLANESEHIEVHSASGAFANRRVWVLSLCYFGIIMGLYGIGFWLPTLIKASGVSDALNVGLLTMIPTARPPSRWCCSGAVRTAARNGAGTSRCRRSSARPVSWRARWCRTTSRWRWPHSRSRPSAFSARCVSSGRFRPRSSAASRLRRASRSSIRSAISRAS